MVNKLKEYIRKSGYKQSYIAAQTGIPYQTLTSYITGRRNPGQKNQEKLAKILNCKTGDLFFANNKHHVYNQIINK